ncbi:hypothetical protein [Chromobacterium violaceum]|uniref:hypothetical protein n=1 Tax=Chromobacterium violaceum TaxID=536 RepID=UPI0005D30C89|nr:hypothetical protein [Chromobacterium violaceum]KJH66726.1 hypothetical protein UF16_14630 [Chromobacterium violaceum]MBT2869485.1 hypothetical protein [Chromobacterium violaceum]
MAVINEQELERLVEIITDPKTIDTYVKEKAYNEFAMAKALCTLFDTPPNSASTPPFYSQLQQITKAALNTLATLNDLLDKGEYPKTLPVVGKLYQSEKKLAIFKDLTIASDDGAKEIVRKANAILKRLLDYDQKAKTIGEIIRVFAGVCEKIKESGAAYKEVENLVIVKTPDISNPLIRFDEFCSTLGAYRTTRYGETAFHPGSRSRCDGKNGNPPPAWRGLKIDPDLATLLGFTVGQLVATGNTFYLPLMPGDVVRCMDSVLGLPEGASISGTTSDTIWAIETLSNFLYVGHTVGSNKLQSNTADPNLILIALAAIVSGYHHTALEVGLPMTINGYITYQPGFYTSFQNEAMTGTGIGQAIQQILNEYEQKKENRLMLITQEACEHRQDGDGRVLRLFDMNHPQEQALFKRSVAMSYDNYLKWQSIAHPLPSTFSRSGVAKIMVL